MRYPGNEVTQLDLRSNTNGQCFYCTGELGNEHDAGCVVIDRPIKVRVTIDLVMTEPRSWSKEEIEYHLNESSWCADNIQYHIRRQIGKGCLCEIAEFECLGDATLEEAVAANLIPDSEKDGVEVEDGE